MARTRTIPAHARAWLLAHPDALPAQVAEALGVAETTARHYRSTLIKAGLIPRKFAIRRPTVDVEPILDLARQGVPAREIKRRLGLTLHEDAVTNIIRRRGVRISDAFGRETFSRNAFQALAGYIQSPPWVARCLAAGLRVEERTARRSGRRWRITGADLRAWFADERSREVLPTHQIQDPAWRAEAERIREEADRARAEAELDRRTAGWARYGRRPVITIGDAP